MSGSKVGLYYASQKQGSVQPSQTASQNPSRHGSEYGGVNGLNYMTDPDAEWRQSALQCDALRERSRSQTPAGTAATGAVGTAMGPVLTQTGLGLTQTAEGGQIPAGEMGMGQMATEQTGQMVTGQMPTGTMAGNNGETDLFDLSITAPGAVPAAGTMTTMGPDGTTATMPIGTIAPTPAETIADQTMSGTMSGTTSGLIPAATPNTAMYTPTTINNTGMIGDSTLQNCTFPIGIPEGEEGMIGGGMLAHGPHGTGDTDFGLDTVPGEVPDGFASTLASTTDGGTYFDTCYNALSRVFAKCNMVYSYGAFCGAYCKGDLCIL